MTDLKIPEDFHYSDEQVMISLDASKILRHNLEARLRLMTTGEKWSLYRAIVNLALGERIAQLTAERDYFKERYGTTLEGEKKALEAASSIAAENDALDADLRECNRAISQIAAERDAALRECERLKEPQHTICAVCGIDKHTPLRRDEMGGYVCLTCIDRELDSLASRANHKEGQ